MNTKLIVNYIIQEIAFYEQAAVSPSISKAHQAHCKLMAPELYCELVDFGIDLPDTLVMVNEAKAKSPLQHTALPGSIIDTDEGINHDVPQ